MTEAFELHTGPALITQSLEPLGSRYRNLLELLYTGAPRQLLAGKAEKLPHGELYPEEQPERMKVDRVDDIAPPDDQLAAAGWYASSAVKMTAPDAGLQSDERAPAAQPPAGIRQT